MTENNFDNKISNTATCNAGYSKFTIAFGVIHISIKYVHVVPFRNCCSFPSVKLLYTVLAYCWLALSFYGVQFGLTFLDSKQVHTLSFVSEDLIVSLI